MTINEIYNQSIKPLRVDERLGIARLILEGLAPSGGEIRSTEVLNDDHLEQLLLDGLKSQPLIEVNDEYWSKKVAKTDVTLS
jgi:hypothetical protein